MSHTRCCENPLPPHSGDVPAILATFQPAFDEVFDVLHRPRLARFVDATLRAELLDRVVCGTRLFGVAVTVTDCRDTAENKYLELALPAQASTIVSSDRDVLVLHPWRGILILPSAK